MRYNIILNTVGHMYQINKKSPTRAGLLLTLVFLFMGNGLMAQSKYDLQVTGGYAISDMEPNMNGYNVDVSVNRHIWSVISLGVYLDYTNVDNLIPEVNGDGSNYGDNFIPFALDSYIKSLTLSEAFSFSQDQANFLSYGIKTNFDFKISKKFKIGFGIGMGLTTRKSASLFLYYFNPKPDGSVDYKLATLFLKATEFSWRYGFNFTYQLSERINAVIQLGHNASNFEKHPTGFTTYIKGNIGIAVKL